MAIGVPQDPVQAAHQLLAMLEYAELDAYDRSVLEWQRETMQRVRAQSSSAVWLQWYRDALGAMRQLQTKWQAAREPAVAASEPSASLAPASAARLKEAHNAFIQRWNVRLQDQALMVKNRVGAEAHAVPVSDVVSQTHIQFTVRPEDLGRFATSVQRVLNEWGADVASKLTPSWHDHLKEVVTAERTPRVSLRPPPWPQVSFVMSALPAPQAESHAVRRPTALMSITRAFRSVQSIATLLIGLALPVVTLVATGGSSESGSASTSALIRALLTAATGVLGLGIGLPLAAWFGFRSLQDEVTQSRSDQAQRIRGSLQLWASQAVDNQRGRIQALLAGSTAEARARLTEWVDQAWDVKPASLPGPRPASKGPDYGPLLLSMNGIRGALATRVAQLEFELGAAVATNKPQA